MGGSPAAREPEKINLCDDVTYISWRRLRRRRTVGHEHSHDNAGQVGLLRAIAGGTLDEQRLTENDRIRLSTLLNAGLIEYRAGAPHLTDVVRDCLLDLDSST
jgi:hypothetical protein